MADAEIQEEEEEEEEFELETDAIYQQLLERCEGKDTAEQAANLCDQVFDFLRRQTRTLHMKRCGPLIKQKLAARIATAKADYLDPHRNDPNKEDRRYPPGMSPEDREREKQGAKKEEEVKPKVQLAQTQEIEELDPATLQPKMEDKEINVDEYQEEEESGEIPNVGNGGSTDTYTWTQSLDDVDMRVEVPINTKGKHLKVEVEKSRIFVGIKGEKPIIDGELEAEVVETMWTLETDDNKKFVCINMDKRVGLCWWKRVVKGDMGIQTKKVQPESNKLDSFDDETRQQVEQMMYDQRQREMGKPTSKEQAQRDKLSNFMEMHPEMDFSGAKFNDRDGGF